MIKLIASDMDGTLLDDTKNFPPDFFSILDRLERHDIQFVIASGRSYRALKPLFNEYCSRLTFICDNGAFIVRNGKTVFTSAIPAETLKDIVNNCYEKLPMAYLVMCGTKGIYVSDRVKPRSEKELGFYYSSRIVCDDLREINDEIFKIAIYDENDPQKYSYPVLNRIYGNDLTLQVSGHLWMDIMNSGINKGTALESIRDSLGITSEETMAFGDFYNDIELLKRAEHSFVMANANDDMKAYGKYTAASNNEYGVTKAISGYLDKNGLL